LGDLSVEDSDFVEDGETFEENAKKKARYYYEKLGGRFEFVLGEDSGIRIDALAGELGVKTRRWGAGEKASDQEWIEYFLKRMESIPEKERGAEFICCAYLITNGEEHFFRGETDGVITDKLEVPIVGGIPLSSCFRPDGFEVVYAALDVGEKNKISHRGKALAPLKKFLEGV
jgi:XTP/dITP diphosphohydrolase